MCILKIENVIALLPLRVVIVTETIPNKIKEKKPL